METTLTVTEAARKFSDLINRIVYRGETAVLTRNGSVVARIVPEKSKKGLTAKEFAEMWANRPKLTKDEADELERFVEEGRRQMNRPEHLQNAWEKWG